MVPLEWRVGFVCFRKKSATGSSQRQLAEAGAGGRKREGDRGERGTGREEVVCVWKVDRERDRGEGEREREREIR